MYESESRDVELWSNTLYYLAMRNAAAHRKTRSSRLESQKVADLDKLAKAQIRDRTFPRNEAVDAYLNVRRWHIEHIRKGLVVTTKHRLRRLNRLSSRMTRSTRL